MAVQGRSSWLGRAERKSVVNKSRILLYDIEATNLKGSIGFVLCIGYKWFGEKKVHVLSIGDKRDYGRTPAGTVDDRHVLERFSKIQEEADFVVFHYGMFYDSRFINTRLLEHGLPPVPPTKFVDTWLIARQKLAMHSNRLGSIGQLLKLPEEKTSIKWKTWRLAGAGCRRSLREIEHHCVQDIKVLEGAYAKLRPLSTTHPNLSVLEGAAACPGCGSLNTLQSRGYSLVATGRRRRYQCMAAGCGKWSHGPPKKVNGAEIR